MRGNDAAVERQLLLLLEDLRLQLRAQILSYSRSRGLFAGVTLNGSTINQDRDANERFYTIGYRTGQIVFDGMGTPTDAAAVDSWKTTLTKYAK